MTQGATLQYLPVNTPLGKRSWFWVLQEYYSMENEFVCVCRLKAVWKPRQDVFVKGVCVQPGILYIQLCMSRRTDLMMCLNIRVLTFLNGLGLISH